MRIFFLFFLFFSSTLNGQTLERALLSSQSAFLVHSAVQLSHTVGEPSVGLLNVPSVQLSIGVHQALDLSILSVEALDFGRAVIYPNPTSQQFGISNKHEAGVLELQVLNSSGQVVIERKVRSDQKVDVQDLASGFYVLRLYDPQSQKQSTYSLIKK